MVVSVEVTLEREEHKMDETREEEETAGSPALPGKVGVEGFEGGFDLQKEVLVRVGWERVLGLT